MGILKELDPKTVHKIKLTGGEPLMDKEGLLKIVKECYKKGFSLKFNTNGLKLDQKYIDLLVKYGIKEINLSIDGLGPLHDYIRGVPGLFDHVESIALYIKNKHPYTKIFVETVMMKVNYHDMPKLVKWADKNRFHALTLKELENYNKNYEELAISTKEMNKLVKKISKMNISMRINKYVFPRNVKKCDYLLHSLNVNSHKEIVPCNKCITNPFVLDRPISQLYRDPEFNNFILNLLNNCNRCYK